MPAVVSAANVIPAVADADPIPAAAMGLRTTCLEGLLLAVPVAAAEAAETVALDVTVTVGLLAAPAPVAPVAGKEQEGVAGPAVPVPDGEYGTVLSSRTGRVFRTRDGRLRPIRATETPGR